MSQEGTKKTKVTFSAQTLLKYAYFKRKNKRIGVFVHIPEENPNVYVLIETKTLIGDWKDRNILSGDFVIGLETLSVLNMIFDGLDEDPEFKKITNRERGQISKNKFTCSSNIRMFQK